MLGSKLINKYEETIKNSCSLYYYYCYYYYYYLNPPAEGCKGLSAPSFPNFKELDFQLKTNLNFTKILTFPWLFNNI